MNWLQAMIHNAMLLAKAEGIINELLKKRHGDLYEKS